MVVVLNNMEISSFKICCSLLLLYFPFPFVGQTWSWSSFYLRCHEDLLSFLQDLNLPLQFLPTWPTSISPVTECTQWPHPTWPSLDSHDALLSHSPWCRTSQLQDTAPNFTLETASTTWSELHKTLYEVLTYWWLNTPFDWWPSNALLLLHCP